MMHQLLGTCGNASMQTRPSSKSRTVNAKDVRVRRCRVYDSRRPNRFDEEDVRLDGDEEQAPRQQASSGPFGVSQILGGFNLVASKITDFTIQFVPPGTPVIVVDRCVKLGLVLGVLAIVRSFLSVILTIGSIGLALYVATRVFGIQIFSEPASSQDEAPRSGSSGRRLPPKRRRRGGDDDDVIDVWYDK